MLCSIYKTAKHDGAYLYVDKNKGLQSVPDTLLNHFGTPVQVMVLLLHAERKLANVDVNLVIKALEKEGFFLQLLSIKEDDDMTLVHKKNTKF